MFDTLLAQHKTPLMLVYVWCEWKVKPDRCHWLIAEMIVVAYTSITTQFLGEFVVEDDLQFDLGPKQICKWPGFRLEECSGVAHNPT
jgi:hypothetical protein